MFIARSYAQVGNVAHVPLAKVFLSWASGPVSTKLGIGIPWVKDGPFLKGDDHFLVKCWFHFLNQRTRVMKVLFKLVNYYIICCPDEKCYYSHILLLNDYCFLRWRYIFLSCLFEFWTDQSLMLTTDEFLPMMIYLIIKSEIPNWYLFSFIHSNIWFFCSINVIDS